MNLSLIREKSVIREKSSQVLLNKRKGEKSSQVFNHSLVGLDLLLDQRKIHIIFSLLEAPLIGAASLLSASWSMRSSVKCEQQDVVGPVVHH